MNAADHRPPIAPLTSDIRSLSAELQAHGPGTFLNEKLELLRLRARGGMGEIWTARHHLLDIEVAVKLIRSDRLTSHAIERLVVEARATARLSHPAIARALDFGRTADGAPFIVLELLHGQSLAERLERDTRLTPEHAVRLLLPIADALAAAHRHGIIHRDLKPENIFLSVDDHGRMQPKLVDFGIALSPTFEQAGVRRRLMATPEYASPEQIASPETTDARADIWALCLVLYEAISGIRPFRRESPMAAIRAVNSAEPFVASAVNDPELAAILERGLRKDRDARFESVQELGNALARWLSQRGYCDDITGMLLKSNWPSAASAGEDQAQSRAPAHPPTTRPPFDAGSSMPAPGFASVTMTLDGLYPEHAAASTAREPSLIAARPSEPPAPVLPLCSVLPESSRSRWSAWGLSSKASKR